MARRHRKVLSIVISLGHWSLRAHISTTVHFSGAEFYDEADVRGRKPIRQIGSGLREATSLYNSALDKRSIVEV